MRKVLLPMIAVTLLAAGHVTGQEPTPSMTTEDATTKVSPVDDQADVKLDDVLRRPEDYLSGSHVADNVEVRSCGELDRNHESSLSVYDHHKGTKYSGIYLDFKIDGLEACEALSEDRSLRDRRARLRFTLFRVETRTLGTLYTARVSSIEFLNDDGSVFKSVR